MIWPFGSMPLFGYDVIDADPPWAFELRSEKGDKKSAQSHYKVMQLDQIAALPVDRLASRDCLLLLWTCGWAMARGDAQAVARAWGATPISEIVWNKVFESGAAAIGPGYRVRTMHEPILVATWGNPSHEAFPSRFYGVRREHSRKPDEWYEIVRQKTPNALRRAALFTREERPGFDCWGDEHGKFDQPQQERQGDGTDQSGGGRPRCEGMDAVRGGHPDLFASEGY